MATLPQHQRKGLGNLILYTLLAHIKKTAAPGAYVTLIGDPPGWKLYEKYGFVDVAARPKGAEKGMSMVLH
jgi:GNAT superfamily N-acetyltransferase